MLLYSTNGEFFKSRREIRAYLTLRCKVLARAELALLFAAERGYR